jgi:nucleolar protein 12
LDTAAPAATPSGPKDVSSLADPTSSDESNLDSTENVSAGEFAPSATKEQEQSQIKRKRKRGGEEDDLEQAYFKRLQREEDKENEHKESRQEVHDAGTVPAAAVDSDENAVVISISEAAEVDDPPRHEIFDKKLNDKEKSNRTVFLGNVSTEAIRASAAKKSLMRHLQSVLKPSTTGESLGKLESIRFRSTAYAANAGPKRATFAKKELMDTTTTSTNAYAVFTTDVAAQHVAKELNGTIVLDRHLRVDYLAKPLPTEHRRCVFVGNLSFMNEETQQPSEDNQQRRPKAKEPADAEEGLWRTFSKCGAVESVRVVRDQETRVSKGFAYVQFKDENSAEAALLMNGKKFPPMLPRILRVMRAHKTKVKPAALPLRAGTRKGMPPRKTSEARGRVGKPVVFEGHRATEGSIKRGKPVSLADRKRDKDKKRPDSKRAQRSANFKRAQATKRKTGVSR